MKRTLIIIGALALGGITGLIMHKANAIEAFQFCEECIEFEFEIPYDRPKFEIPKPRIEPPKIEQRKVPIITQQDIKVHKPSKSFYYKEEKKAGIFNDALIRRQFENGQIIDCPDEHCDQPLQCLPNDKENVN